MGKYDFDLDIFGNNTISWIAKSVDICSSVLEFGPANGRLTKYLAEQKKCKVDIVEIDSESGKEAALYAEKALLGSEEGNIENYYWIQTEKKYDYIIFADVLEHLINPQDVLEHCSAVIAEKGKILVSIPNASHNSVIIELFNDEFEYNPTGILDNTHLKFFTRKSFERMAQNAGWTIIGEKAKQIRVGETEINNSYKDVPKNLFKELIHRENGNYYQYMFVLASCENYLSGTFERSVSLDSTSYYFSEVYTEWDGKFDYKHSISKHFDPYYGWLDVTFPLTGEGKKALIKPINCNCILSNLKIKVETDAGEKVVEIERSNGFLLEENIISLDDILELEICLPENSHKIIVQAQVLDYDFNKSIYESFVYHIEKKESEILEREQRLSEKDKHSEEILKQINQLEAELREKDNRIKEICNDY
ncbi:class I SAM-dependent methyltransferase, partial [Lachnospiraceae bacterium OF09-6]